jgi:hypothetical protein
MKGAGHRPALLTLPFFQHVFPHGLTPVLEATASWYSSSAERYFIRIRSLRAPCHAYHPGPIEPDLRLL